jgi:transposase
MAVMIGIDPHKASHTAVAISAAEEPLGELRVRACAARAEQLLAWAAAWPRRTWAVEGAGGLGHLLAQQLLATGERVLDVPPKLGARVRLVAAGDTNENDPNDARSVAVAALRSAGVREVRPDDHAAVLKVWSKRYRDLGRTRTQVVCRLHAVLCDLVPGGVSRPIYASHAARILEQITPQDAVATARCELAAAFLDDLRRIDAQIRETKNKLATAVQATGTSLIRLFGVGPVIAAAVIGDVRDVSRFPGRDHFVACNGTAPIEVSSGPRKIYRLSRHPPGSMHDEHQDVQALQQHGVHVEEVDGEDPSGLGVQELPPGRARAARRRIDARGAQDLPDCGLRHCHAEFRQFAVDPAVSHSGLSFARRTTRRAMLRTVGGRPGARCLLVSYFFAASLRCQASNVAGLTGKTSVQRVRGMSRASAASHTRSDGS